MFDEYQSRYEDHESGAQPCQTVPDQRGSAALEEDCAACEHEAQRSIDFHTRAAWDNRFQKCGAENPAADQHNQGHRPDRNSEDTGEGVEDGTTPGFRTRQLMLQRDFEPVILLRVRIAPWPVTLSRSGVSDWQHLRGIHLF